MPEQNNSNTNQNPNNGRKPARHKGKADNGRVSPEPINWPQSKAAQNGITPHPTDATDTETPRQAPWGPFWNRWTSWENNPIPRWRRWKKFLGINHYVEPPSDDVLFDKTPLEGAVDVLRGSKPCDVGILEWYYDHRVRAAARRVVAHRHSIYEALREEKEAAAKNNEGVDRDVEKLKSDLEAVIRAALDQLQFFQKELLRADIKAAAAVACVGGGYNSRKPDFTCIPHEKPLDEAVIAARLKLPWTASKWAAVEKVLALLTTVFNAIVLGAATGVSAGLASESLEGDNLLRHPEVTAFFAILGIFIAGRIGVAVRSGIHEASERYWLGLARSVWLPILLIALGESVAFAVIEALVHQRGLLSESALVTSVQNAVGGGTTLANGGSGGENSMASFMCGFLVSLPYIASLIWSGSLSGRRAACKNRIAAAQEEEFKPREAQWHGRPEVQKALAAIADVQSLLKRQAQVQQQMAKSEAWFAKRIALCEKKRQTVQEGMTKEQKLLHEDYIQDWVGSQATFDKGLESLRRGEELPADLLQGSNSEAKMQPAWLSKKLGFLLVGGFGVALLLFLGSLWWLGI